MTIIAYDISDNKKRAKFSKFLSKYGVKIQYSVYRIKNSKRVLSNILTEIDHKYKKLFDNTDSVYIFQICESCKPKIIRYGSSLHEDEDVVYLE